MSKETYGDDLAKNFRCGSAIEELDFESPLGRKALMSAR
jgi:hypothetical protein